MADISELLCRRSQQARLRWDGRPSILAEYSLKFLPDDVKELQFRGPEVETRYRSSFANVRGWGADSEDDLNMCIKR